MCVTSCLSKFFCIILNDRLSNFSYQQSLIHPSQIGFQSGHQTADHIFTLKTLIDKQVEQNKGKIDACFVDLKNFDSIWHEGLFLKLLENKIDGQFYSLIKSLYSNSKCAIKTKQHQNRFFHLF
jgi:hypothetical protein